MMIARECLNEETRKMSDLEAIEKRADAATPGPWHPYFTLHGDPFVVDDSGSGLAGQVCALSVAPDDYGRVTAEFIAHAREDVPALVAEVRGLREANERWKSGSERLRQQLRDVDTALDRFQRPLGVGRVQQITELREALRRWHAECDKVGIPRDDPEGFVRHHRNNAAFAAAVTADTDARIEERGQRDALLSALSALADPHTHYDGYVLQRRITQLIAEHSPASEPEHFTHDVECKFCGKPIAAGDAVGEAWHEACEGPASEQRNNQ